MLDSLQRISSVIVRIRCSAITRGVFHDEPQNAIDYIPAGGFDGSIDRLCGHTQTSCQRLVLQGRVVHKSVLVSVQPDNCISAPVVHGAERNSEAVEQLAVGAQVLLDATGEVGRRFAARTTPRSSPSARAASRTANGPE